MGGREKNSFPLVMYSTEPWSIEFKKRKEKGGKCSQGINNNNIRLQVTTVTPVPFMVE